MTKKMMSLGLMLWASLTVACTSPNASSPEASTPNASNSATPDEEDPAAVTVEGQIAPENLTRVQFVNAMKCAKEKTDDKSLEAGFDSQLTVFEPASSDANFKSIMALGGGGSYIIYKEAAKLGCSGQ